MYVGAGGGGVQRGPQLAVQRVHVRSVLDEKPRHRFRVVDATLSAHDTHTTRSNCPRRSSDYNPHPGTDFLSLLTIHGHDLLVTVGR